MCVKNVALSGHCLIYEMGLVPIADISTAFVPVTVRRLVAGATALGTQYQNGAASALQLAISDPSGNSWLPAEDH